MNPRTGRKIRDAGLGGYFLQRLPADAPEKHTSAKLGFRCSEGTLFGFTAVM